MPPHRMTAESAPTGRTWELTLAPRGDEWVATWQTLRAGRVEVPGVSGSLVAATDDAAFREARRHLEDLDPALVDADWAFEAPLPSWMSNA